MGRGLNRTDSIPVSSIFILKGLVILTRPFFFAIVGNCIVGVCSVFGDESEPVVKQRFGPLIIIESFSLKLPGC